MTDCVVVGASLAIKRLVDEDESYLALALLRSWVGNDMARSAPALMRYEVTNALHRRVIRGEMTVDAASALIDRLQLSRIEFSDPPELHRMALEVANQVGQGASYDSHYLALAEIFECELWTAERRFYRAVNPITNRVRLLSDWSPTRL